MLPHLFQLQRRLAVAASRVEQETAAAWQTRGLLAQVRDHYHAYECKKTCRHRRILGIRCTSSQWVFGYIWDICDF